FGCEHVASCDRGGFVIRPARGPRRRPKLSAFGDRARLNPESGGRLRAHASRRGPSADVASAREVLRRPTLQLPVVGRHEAGSRVRAGRDEPDDQSFRTRKTSVSDTVTATLLHVTLNVIVKDSPLNREYRVELEHPGTL